MNELTILLWITIFIIGVIAIIGVKLHYKGDELEKDEKSIISSDTFSGILSYGQDKVDNTPQKHFTQPQFENDINPIEEVPQDEYGVYIEPIEEVPQDEYDVYIEPQVEENDNYKNIAYESENQVLINYDNEVEKFQEPMTEKQVEIMTPDNEKHELKDLFTIDELIKESKRKDSEREKEAQQISKDDDAELDELKESIRQRKENGDVEEKLIEEIMADEEINELLASDENEEVVEEEPTIQQIIEEKPAEKEPTIQQIIEEKPAEEEPTIQQIIEEKPADETVQEVSEVDEEKEDSIEEAITAPVEEETPSVASQKDIAEAIDNASQEIEEKEIESISDGENITDVLLNSEEEIKEPVLKTPTKIGESKDENLSAPIDDSNLYQSKEENDLDYRKDLAKITNTIKGSKLFQDVKDKLTGQPEPEIDPLADIQDDYIRNVNEFEEYDEYAPINETHDEFGEVYEPDYDQAIREENTRRLMKNAKPTPEPELAEPKIGTIKPKPSRDNIKIQLGNADVVVKKGDEIIFRHDGETYSSQVYAINGDDISVRYRGKNITIKPDDVKKVY